MKIAWIGKKSPACGNVTYCRETTNALLKRHHDVTFMHFASESAGQTQQTVFFPYLYKSGTYTIPSLQARKILVESLTNARFDLVHASLVLSPLDFYLPWICTKLKLPLVATFHQPFDSQYRTSSALLQELTYRMYGPILALYDCTIVFSQLQMALLQRMGVPKERIAVIPNSVDIEKYSPGFSNIKEQWQAKFLFVYQGRLVSEKNVEALLEVWSQIPKPEGYKLAVVGTGALAAKLKSRYSCDRDIIWIGFVDNEQQRIDILRAADVFVLPSLVEGLSMALLEAMACGVACIATNAGSHNEVLNDGVGFVVDVARLKQELRDALLAFIRFPNLAKTLGIKARQRVLERYTLSHNTNQLETLYHQVISSLEAGAKSC
ncbi:MAG: glycosyltransferase family 4 protein [Synechococcales bacterium]|nr:glycosyltransferase family 4 protein [Synechococcales bacterium]